MAITVNIREAKSGLSGLVERAERGEEIIITRSGKPVVRLTRWKPQPKKRELGFLAGYDFHVPDDFNEMGREEIEKMFDGQA